MTTQDEIENKYLVKVPSSWNEIANLLTNLVDIRRISQTYLEPEGDNPAARVRKTIQGLNGQEETIYDYNLKKPKSTGVHRETEKKISEQEYLKYLEKPYPGKNTVEKTRFVFEYKDQIFELDVFKGPLEGIAILEIELSTKGEQVDLPPFLNIRRNITSEEKFNNFNLADY